jgi:protein-tyrosine phosphatase
MPSELHPRASVVAVHRRTGCKLWLGSMRDAHDRGFLEREDIGAVVNCTKRHPFSCHVRERGLLHLRVPVDDSRDQVSSMDGMLDGAILFIRDSLRSGKPVLVHCYAGMQRAATVCAAFLSEANGEDHLSSMLYLKEKRPVVFHGQATFLRALRRRYPTDKREDARGLYRKVFA